MKAKKLSSEGIACLKVRGVETPIELIKTNFSNLKM